MSTFTATPEEMRMVSDLIASEYAKYVDVIANINAQITNLGQNWEGMAYESFRESFNSKLPYLNEGAEMTREFNMKLLKAAGDFEESEQRISGKLV